MRLSRGSLLSVSILLLCASVFVPPVEESSAVSSAAGASPVGDGGDVEQTETLRDRLKLVEMRRERWRRVIETQQTLAQHPEKLSQAAADAARDLRDSGREMVFDGVSGGLSNVLKLQAYYARDDRVTARRLKEAAAGVEFAYKLFVKERVGGAKKGEAKPEEVLDKVNATIGLGVEEISDPKVRGMVKAMMGLSKGTTGFLSAYARDDRPQMSKRFGDVQSLLGGTLAMMSAMSATEDPEELAGRAALIAARFPEFGDAAKFMATTALTDFNLALALANVGWGTYGMWSGYDLENQAEAIREQQQKAAVILQRLLPRARQEVLQAQEEEARLRTQLEAVEAREPLPLAVLPSQRFIDDGVAVPARETNLPLTLDVIRELPAVTSGITEEEKRRRERAAREAERRRLAEAEEARREARRQRLYAEERDDSYRLSRQDSSAGSSGGSSSGDSPAPAAATPVSDDDNSCWKRHCLGGDPNGAMNRIINELNKQQNGSTLGPIRKVP